MGGVAAGGFGDEDLFEGAPGLIHLAAGDFFGWGVDEINLADGEVIVFVADGRAEGSALDGASGVEIASAGDGVEDGAGLVVGEVLEGLFVVGFGEERACGWVAGEVGCEAGAGGGGAGEDAVGESRFGGGEGVAEGFGVEGRDREDADAAEVAAGSAGKPIAGAGGGGGEGGVEDLEKGLQEVENKQYGVEKTRSAGGATFPAVSVVR